MSGPAPSHARNPQIIVAIIGAITTIGAAVITALAALLSNSNPPAPTSTPIVITATPIPAVVEVTPTPPTLALLASPSPLPLGTPVLFTNVPAAVSTSPINMLLLYDDVSFSLLNQSGSTLSLEGVTFRSASGSWDARDWGPSLYTSLPNGMCLRLRDATVGQRQPPAPCVNKIYGLIVAGRSALFWINTESFEVIRNGTVLATCQTAEGSCTISS